MKLKNAGYYIVLFIILTGAITTSLFIVNSCSEEPKNANNIVIAQEESSSSSQTSNSEDEKFSSNDPALIVQNQYRKIAKANLPSVVHITSLVEQEVPSIPFFFPFFGNLPQDPSQKRKVEVFGSGFIISKEGHILTNYHVVNNVKDLRVRLMDGSEFEGKVLGTDQDLDVAVIKINPAGKILPVVKLGDSDSLEIGDIIFAIGNPFGLDGTFTQGIVSAKGRTSLGINQYENFIQIDAAINPGNSGGPLLNIKGEVVGINDAIYSQTGNYAGVGFAIPINIVKKNLNDLIAGKPIEYGYLGVSVMPMDNDKAEYYGLKQPTGVIVVSVEPNSPASKAGVKNLDVILTYNGKKINNAGELSFYIKDSKPNEKVTLQVLRKIEGKVKTINLTVIIEKRQSSNLSQQKPDNWLGVLVGDLDDSLKEKYKQWGVTFGVVVLAISNKSPAAQLGIAEGDVIYQINDYEIKSAEQFYQVLDKVKTTKKIVILINRRGSSLMLTIGR
ncbi:MAG TPA: Do family serine endopeptidase [Exilispira sp.]|nr:Do family serine endopeptidase [Exilispira sp.]